MKMIIFLYFLINFFVIIGCNNKKIYVYPMQKRLEIQRVCFTVLKTNTKRFMVLLGKIYPLNNDGYSIPFENMSTTLEDAGYFCGNYRMENAPCPIGETQNIYKNDCFFAS